MTPKIVKLTNGDEINKGNNVTTKLAALKNTTAYKELVEAASTYSP